MYPPNGRVRVAAPLGISNDAVRLAVVGKLAWIKKQKARFASQARQAEREMVSGESHYYLGRRYRLRVVNEPGRAGVVVKNRTTLELRVPRSYPAQRREQVLERWYRQRLRELIPPLVVKWERILGVRAAAFGIRRMKTKWGACSVDRGHVWLNFELVKKPLRCLEYVAVHELDRSHPPAPRASPDAGPGSHGGSRRHFQTRTIPAGQTVVLTRSTWGAGF